MIRFFRRIRSQQLTDSRFGKYFIYAIGEIILVMIGILLALQVNNWNQNRVRVQHEIVHLKNLSQNISDNINVEIVPCIDWTKEQIRAYEVLQGILSEPEVQVPLDSVRRTVLKFMVAWDFVLNTAAFDNLTSDGVDLISDEKMKIDLLTLYGYHYKYLIGLHEEYDKFHIGGLTELLHDNIEIRDGVEAEEIDFIKNDIRVRTRMRTEYHHNKMFVQYLELVKGRSEQLLQDVNAVIIELERR